MAKQRIGIAHHTSRKRGIWSAEYGTPEYVIALVRKMFGRIDCDLASSDKFNESVGAEWCQLFVRTHYNQETTYRTRARFPVATVGDTSDQGEHTSNRKEGTDQR